nr:integrase, catalytic region, zinc finger, CCHC-type, peptidase aspartic, catalytic [Tanacetum cinerariifolium]
MVPTECKKVEAYIRGLSENIKGEVASSKPATLSKAVQMAHTLMEQKVKAKAEREADNKKRKWENFQGGSSSGGGNNNSNRNNNNYNSNRNYNNNRNNNQNHLNAKTLNVKYVSDMCDKCVLYDKHDICVLKSVAKPIKRTVASKSNKKPRHFTRKLYERISKICSWWYPNFTPSGYIWKPKSGKENVNPNLIEIFLFIIDSGCSKHMTGNLKFLTNFVKKFLGTVKFGNDQIAPILGYGDLVQGAVMIKRAYYVEGLNHNLFSVGQFCDADLEVDFRKSTCFIHDLKGNDLLTGSRGMDIDGENLGKMKEKGDECIFVGYSTQSSAYRTMVLNHDSLILASHHQENVTQVERTVTTSNELDLLFSLMFDELLKGSSKVVSKSSAASAADAPNQRQHHTTPLNIHTTPTPTCQVPTLVPTISPSENLNQAETYDENDQVADDEFINIFSTPVQDQGETSSRHVDSSNMDT